MLNFKMVAIYTASNFVFIFIFLRVNYFNCSNKNSLGFEHSSPQKLPNARRESWHLFPSCLWDNRIYWIVVFAL